MAKPDSELNEGAAVPLHDHTDVPDSAALLPLDIDEPAAASPPVVDAAITTKLKNTPEQRKILGPLVRFLTDIGWQRMCPVKCVIGP